MTRSWWRALGLACALVACGDDDMTMPDAGPDAPPECALPADCDDGLFCNGEETCVDGACVFRDAPACDDGIECTLDLCDEELDACVNAAPDMDGDGAMDAACLDADGAPLGTDCDDADNNRFPGNPEVCDRDGHDEDCDLDTFGERDADRDGFFDATCCNPAADGGDPLCGNDCNDARPNVNREAAEACDGVDNDCDGAIDEGVLVAGLVDADRDGFGDPDMPMEACPGTAGFVVAGGEDDCDDGNVAVNPGQPEICDGIDNDCDPATTDADASPVTWYRDADGDGFGSELSGTTTSCEPVEGHSLLNTDCNDAVASISPAAAERCDAIDNDCNGVADFMIGPGDFEDDDGDGLVDIACGAPRGIDCDDLDPDAGPGTTESCDGRDNDCDDRVDEGAADLSWFYDGDGDGHGAASAENPVVRDCTPPPMHVASGADCDDADPDVRPGATELCDMRDGDCDGAVDEGGVCTCPAGLGDCDDDGVCETDVTRTVAHCGGCGMACAAPNVQTARCQSGACEAAICVAGFADCDGDFANGCETDLQADAMHCGGCGVTCALAPDAATMACRSGRCEVGTCEPGFGDCNRRVADGCERDVSSDLDHCGACNNFCVPSDVPVSCDAGACRYECLGGVSDDCDGDAANGCETIVDDPMNCGSCGVVCPGGGMNATAECIQDTGGGHFCELRCDDGFADCNGSSADGCEATVTDSACGCGFSEDCTTFFGPGNSGRCVADGPGNARCELESCGGGDTACFGSCVDTDMDPANCGTCGNNCGIGFCNMGSCDCSSAGSRPGFCPDFGCVDLDFDLSNCGTCGNVCAPSETCERGVCGPNCGGGSARFCDGACRDTNSDPLHCGFCGNACAAGETCRFGGCELDCSYPEENCGTGSCVNLLTDVDHCGTCGMGCPTTAPFASGGTCTGGECELFCEPARGDCNGDPFFDGCEADLDSDPMNCGGCGVDCGPGGECALGSCDTVIDVAIGTNHACAVRAGGAVVCWGDNTQGQLGQDPMFVSGSSEPMHVGLAFPARRVTVGDFHTCAITSGTGADFVACWGNDSMTQQLGDGPGLAGGREAWQPHDVSGLPGGAQEVIDLDAGALHTCALVRTATETRPYCWGNNSSGECGLPDATNPVSDIANPIGVSATEYEQLLVGDAYACVNQGGVFGSTTLECWGNNAFSKLGRSGADDHVPSSVSFASSHLVRRLVGGQSHTCAVVDGELWCWGADGQSQTGLGATTATPTQVFIPGAPELVDALADDHATCVLDVSGAIHCRGANNSRTLIDDPATTIGTWRRVPGPAATRLSGGIGRARCFLTAEGTPYCFGDNGAGQLGRGTTGPPTAAPQPVRGISP